MAERVQHAECNRDLPKVWWVGGIDWNERLFHGYTTERGITYNAYLIMDEKITLIDTCKATFADELVQRISQVVDPAKIDVVITNHVEMDHSGSLPVIHKIAPNAQIYASAGAGVNEVRAHFGIEATPVKGGDTLCIGERTLAFVTTPMVHWPDNMVTYSDVDQILFSNDAFGQHYATTKRFDDENDLCEIFKQAKKYYANIVWPYGMQAHKALEAVKALELKMIAPSHGCIWRSHIPEILERYEAWTTYQTEEKAVVVFDSMWHSTESMAREICDAFIAEGVSAQLIDVKNTHISDIMLYMCDARYVASVRPPSIPTCCPPWRASSPTCAVFRPRTTSVSALPLAHTVGLRSAPSRCTPSSRTRSSSCRCPWLPNSGFRARRTSPSCRTRFAR